jgi:hypothetical protein
MRFQLPAWPVGPWFVPAGTIISAVTRDGEIVEPVIWNGIVLPMPPPMDAAALDEEAALLMLRAYPEFWFRLGFGRGVDREAILAEARSRIARGLWPRYQ